MHLKIPFRDFLLVTALPYRNFYFASIFQNATETRALKKMENSINFSSNFAA